MVIGSPEIYEVNAAQPKIGSYYDFLRACTVSGVIQGVTGIACPRDQGFSGSSLTTGAEHATDDLRTYYLVAAQNKFIDEMQQQQLSLKTHQGQRLAAPTTGADCPDSTYRTISQIKG